MDCFTLQSRFFRNPIFWGIVFGCLSLPTSPSWAVITFTDISGASASLISTNNSGGTPTTPGTTNSTAFIYAGIGGHSRPSTNCASGATEPCDGCSTADGWILCNRRMIGGSTRLSISFRSDTTVGTAALFDSNGIKLTPISNTITTAVNEVGTVTLAWGTVCGSTAIGGSNSDCTISSSPKQGTFKVAFDTNNNGSIDSGEDSQIVTITVIDPDTGATGNFDTIDDCATNGGLGTPKVGVCGFTAYPGDAKVYIDSPEIYTGFPATGSGTAKKIQIWYSTQNFQTVDRPSLASVAELDFEVKSATEISFPDNMVTGLNNSDVFYFRASIVDEANNSYYFTSNTAITNTCPSGLTQGLPYDQTCTFYAAPSEVYGFLDKDLNCFIATAASGSNSNTLVQWLREFRNQALLPFNWGRLLVRFYYRVGPYGARWLNHHSWAKGPTLAMLWPLAIVARVVSALGWLKALLGFSLAMILSGLLLARRTGAKRIS